MDKKVFILSYVFVFLLSLNTYAESGTYREVGNKIHTHISTELRESTSFTGGFMREFTDGVYFTKYDVRDNSYFPELIRQSLIEYERHDKKITISITLYSISHKEYRNMNTIERYSTQIFKLKLKGK